jgi:hypothetical protein
MLLCCLIPIGVIAILWAAGVSSTYLTLAFLLLCPLLHIAMMIGQKNHNKDSEKLTHH